MDFDHIYEFDRRINTQNRLHRKKTIHFFGFYRLLMSFLRVFQLPLFRTILLQQYCRGMIKHAPFFSTFLAQYITGIVQGKQHAGEVSLGEYSASGSRAIGDKISG